MAREALFVGCCYGHYVMITPKADLIPRSCFGGSRTKKWGRGEGKGEEETRSGKIRIETSADWLFHNARERSTHMLFLSLAVPKTFIN